MSDDYRTRLRHEVRSLPDVGPPPPWQLVDHLLVGGLHSVGMATDDRGLELILVISHSGRSVVDSDGRKLARDDTDDRQPWLDPYHLVAEGIGPLGDRPVPIAGLYGGGLATTTSDGWTVTKIELDWPDERIVLSPPYQPTSGDRMFVGATAIDDGLDSPVRAVGFSPSGRLLVVATSSTLSLWQRTAGPLRSGVSRRR